MGIWSELSVVMLGIIRSTLGGESTVHFTSRAPVLAIGAGSSYGYWAMLIQTSQIQTHKANVLMRRMPYPYGLAAGAFRSSL